MSEPTSYDGTSTFPVLEYSARHPILDTTGLDNFHISAGDKLGNPERDIGGALVFLAGEVARFITAQVIAVSVLTR